MTFLHFFSFSFSRSLPLSSSHRPILQGIVDLVVDKPTYEVGGVLYACAGALQCICNELGKGYTRNIVLPKLVGGMGLELSSLVNPDTCPVLSRSAETEAKFACLSSILRTKTSCDVAASTAPSSAILSLILPPAAFRALSFNDNTNLQSLSFGTLPSQIVTERRNNGRTVVIKKVDSRSGMRVGDVITGVSEGGGAEVLRYRVQQPVRDDLMQLVLETVLPLVDAESQKFALKSAIISTATASLPLDCSSTISGLGKMCGMRNKRLLDLYLQTLFELSMHDDARVKGFVATLLGDASGFVEETDIKSHIVPALLSLAHKSQKEGVQIAAVRVVLRVLVTCGDAIVERALCGRLREYANSGEAFDRIVVAISEGLSAGILSIDPESKKADFWVEVSQQERRGGRV